jgi:GMP synthase (glutamine-hydrolysing)
MLIVLGDVPSAPLAGGRTAELDLVTAAVERDFPTLAIGFGAELVATAGGAKVRVRPAAEVGWSEVQVTDQGHSDPATVGLPEAFVGLHWHRHEVDLPHGAVRLAGSDRCENQIFRVGRRVHGFLYRPEVTGWMIERWIDSYPEDLASSADAIPQLHRDTADNTDRARQLLRDLLRRWLPAVGVVPVGLGPVVNRAV